MGVVELDSGSSYGVGEIKVVDSVFSVGVVDVMESDPGSLEVATGVGDESAAAVCLLVVTGMDGDTISLLVVDTRGVLDIVLVVADGTAVGACVYAKEVKWNNFNKCFQKVRTVY